MFPIIVSKSQLNSFLKYETEDNQFNQNLQQKMMILSKTLVCIKVIPNRKYGKRLLKIQKYASIFTIYLHILAY